MKNQFNVSIFSNYSVSINFANVIRVRKISNIEFQIRFKTDTITDTGGKKKIMPVKIQISPDT